MNYKVAQKKFTKDWEREGTPQMVEFLNDRFRNQMYGQIRDEFDEIVTPWPTGFVFDKNTSQADMELLNKLCHEKDIAVFGVTSNIYEEFDEYDSKHLYDIGFITDAPTDAHILSVGVYPRDVNYKGNGFWPNSPTQVGHLPMMIFYKAFKYDNKRKCTPYV